MSDPVIEFLDLLYGPERGDVVIPTGDFSPATSSDAFPCILRAIERRVLTSKTM
jgi:hypothetical protein